MATRQTLGDRVLELRLARGMSQAELAAGEHSDSYISLIESGKRDPSQEVIKTLARKLGCSAMYLQHGLGEEAMADLKTRLRYACNALANGRANEALVAFNELASTPNLQSFPDLHRQVRHGKAQAMGAAGRLQDAIDEFEELAKTARGMDWDEWASMQTALLVHRRKNGDLACAVEAAEEALVHLTDVGADGTDAAIHLAATLLDVFLENGDLVLARQLAGWLVRIVEKSGSPDARVEAYRHAAIVADADGDYERGLQLAERALVALTENDGIRTLGHLRVAYAGLLLKARPDQAERAYSLLLQHSHEVGLTAPDEACCLIELARAEIAMERPDNAATRAQQAIDLLNEEPSRATAQALTVLGEALVRLGRQQEAITVLRRGAEYLDTIGLPREAAQAWVNVADQLCQAGADAEEQAATFRRALIAIGLAPAPGCTRQDAHRPPADRPQGLRPASEVTQ